MDNLWAACMTFFLAFIALLPVWLFLSYMGLDTDQQKGVVSIAALTVGAIYFWIDSRKRSER